MTGRIPSQHGVHDYLSEGPDFARDWFADEILLPEPLRQAGYRTALICKWHCAATSFMPNPSFDRWLSYDQGPEGWPNQYLHQGRVHLSNQGSPISIEGFQIEYLGQAVLDFIAAGDPTQPCFLVFAPTDTHQPLIGHPEESAEGYRNRDLSGVPAGETVNHFESPEYQKVVAGLSTALDRHFERYEVPEHSGRTVIDQPPCNGIEPWRKWPRGRRDNNPGI